jgi:hypothetical protein
MMVGVGFVAVLTGAIAQRFIAPTEEAVVMGERRPSSTPSPRALIGSKRATATRLRRQAGADGP